VLLATGGAGQVFRETTNPAVATGDGIALAYRAGARVADLEFVQFHPTALSVPGAPRFLLSEALRGEGAKLVNARGEPFMERYDRAADLAPRDVVARAIVREMEVTDGPVYLTLQHLNAERVRARFPTITAMCSRAGLDVACDRIPVGPAAHYMMGGIDTDVWGRTSIAGLFAAGETACTGVHGANRLASNSLLEGLVFGARAAEAMQQTAQAATTRPDRIPAADLASHDSSTGTPAAAAFSGSFAIDEIRDLMWRAAGLFRTRHRLAPAVEALSQAFSSARESAMTTADGDIEPWRCFNLATVALLVARAALRREESRGGHYRADFPARDDLHWKVHVTEEIDRGVRL
jgi:L-aspartate oxidase